MLLSQLPTAIHKQEKKFRFFIKINVCYVRQHLLVKQYIIVLTHHTRKCCFSLFTGYAKENFLVKEPFGLHEYDTFFFFTLKHISNVYLQLGGLGRIYSIRLVNKYVSG